MLNLKKNWKVLVIALVCLLGAWGVLYYFQTYMNSKVTNFVSSQFPELDVVNKAIQTQYPDPKHIGINIRKNSINGGPFVETLAVSLVNSNYSRADMQTMGKLACQALNANKLAVDTVVVREVKNYDLIVFNFSSTGEVLGGSCDWWLDLK